MGFLIDTSVIIASERGKLSLEERLAQTPGVWVGIASVSAAELLEGVHLADPAHQAKRAEFVSRILESLPVVPLDLRMCREYARLRADLRRQGAPVGIHDLQIAATAIALGERVATRDAKSFPRIPGLKYELW